MPTATGRLTADEKREADRIRSRDARIELTARLTTPEWIAEQADTYETGLRAHQAGQATGTIPGYVSFELWYPADEEHVVNRIKIDAGKARSYGVSDELRRRGVDHSCMLSFGLFAGRSTIRHGIVSR